jgi:hypothetical protein
MGMVLIAGNTPGAVSWGFVSANTVGAATINHTHPDATESTDGFMSSVDKIKLDAILINIPAITEGIEGYVLSIDNSQQVVWTAFTAASIGLSFVDNTADMDKPISTATIIGLQAKANTVHTHVSNDVSDATSVLNSDNIVKRDSTGSFEAYNVILHNNINISGTCTAQSVRGGFGGGFAAFYPIANTLNLEYGKCYIIDSNNNASLSSKYMDDGIVGIISDTADYISGSETQALPIITSGFTLASVDQVYPPGTPLTCGIDGVLVKIEDVDKVQFPEKIIATFIRGETETLWNNISVNGRHWVKI